jgi:hypothetical protein
MATDTDDHLISGLLRKRHQLAAEAVAVRDRLAQVSSAIDSIDHVLSTMGEPPVTWFTAAFLLQCLTVIACKDIRIDDVMQPTV